MNNLIYSKEVLGSLSSVVHKYTGMVKKIAHHLLCRLPHWIQLDDLIQSGMIGLLEAYRNYNQDKGASFETYAGIRIRGAMLDEIRKVDWVPRSVHKNSRIIAEAIKKLENELGKDPSEREIAASLKLSLQEYHQLLQDSVGARLFGLDEIILYNEPANSLDRDPFPGPLEQIQNKDFCEHIAKCIASLNPKEALILTLYYQEELNLKEIGEVLNVTESRISQIMSQSIIKLQSRLKQLN